MNTTPFRLNRQAWLQASAVPLVAVTLLAGLARPAGAQPASGPGPDSHGAHHAMMGRHGPAGGPGVMSDRLLDSVGATAEQKAKVHQIMGSAHDEMRKQREADRGLHQQMMALMAAPQVDAVAAENLRQQMQARHDAASKRHLQAMLDASAVLSPEQRAKLAERLKARQEMMERHHHERQAAEPRS